MFTRLNTSFEKLLDKLGGWLDTIIQALPNLLLAAIFLAFSLLVARYLKRLSLKVLDRTTGNKTVKGLLSNLIVAAFMLIVLFVILNILNLDEAVTALLGTAGVAGLAVGLALQDPIINLFSGVLMSVRDYYQVGDLVETNSFFGRISRINLRSTILLTPDGQEVVIPNKEVLQRPIKNYSHQASRRIEIPCGVSYGDDLEQAKSIAIQAIESSSIDRAPGKPVELYFTEFGDSSINFVLRFWILVDQAPDFFTARDAAIIALKKAFDQHNINIPFPIRTLDLGEVNQMRLGEAMGYQVQDQ